MRRIIVFFMVLGAAIAGSVLLHSLDMYLFFVIGEWQMENTDPLPILVTLFAGYLGVWCAYKCLRFVYCLLSAGAFQEFQDKRGRRAAAESLNKGLIDLIECNWKSAENRLLSRVDYSETPLLNYLGAARAASQQGKFERRDQYLRAAHENDSKANIAILLTQADLQLSHQQTEQALATLSKLRLIAPLHGYVLKLLSRLHHQLREWDKLASILPDLKKKNVLTPKQLEELELDTYQGILEDAAKHQVEKTLSEAWKSLPKVLQKDSRLSAVYASALISQGNHEEAEKQIKTSLGKHWDEHLVQLYGQLRLENNSAALAQARNWEHGHEDSPALQLTIARLSCKERLWGEAQAAFRKAIALKPSAEAFSELADMLESIGRGDDATQLYKKGIQLSVQTRTDA